LESLCRTGADAVRVAIVAGGGTVRWLTPWFAADQS
jgi:hypothetical protein